MSTRGDRRWFPNWTHAAEARTHNLKEGDGSVDADTLDSAVHSFSCSWPQVCNTDNTGTKSGEIYGSTYPSGKALRYTVLKEEIQDSVKTASCCLCPQTTLICLLQFR